MSEQNPQSPTSHLMEAIKAIEAGAPHVTLPEHATDGVHPSPTLELPAVQENSITDSEEVIREKPTTPYRVGHTAIEGTVQGDNFKVVGHEHPRADEFRRSVEQAVSTIKQGTYDERDTIAGLRTE